MNLRAPWSRDPLLCLVCLQQCLRLFSQDCGSLTCFSSCIWPAGTTEKVLGKCLSSLRLSSALPFGHLVAQHQALVPKNQKYDSLSYVTPWPTVFFIFNFSASQPPARPSLSRSRSYKQMSTQTHHSDGGVTCNEGIHSIFSCLLAFYLS